MHQHYSRPPSAISISRTWRFATSGDIVQGSHTFKMTLQDNDFLKTPTYFSLPSYDATPMHIELPTMTRRCKIPKLTSPSLVNLTYVVDIFLVAPQISVTPKADPIRRSSIYILARTTTEITAIEELRDCRKKKKILKPRKHWLVLRISVTS